MNINVTYRVRIKQQTNERKQIKLFKVSDTRFQPNVDERANRDGSNQNIQRSEYNRRRRRRVFVLWFINE
jgi:hypothetical protein